MKQILQPRRGLSAICGPQKKKDLPYRLTTHCVQLSCPDGALFYQTLTGELILLENGETVEAQRDELIRRRFLVPQDFDEQRYLSQVRQLLSVMAKKKTGFSRFLIFTTMDCNARCYYCYELGRARPVMSADTARETAAYIIRNRAEGEVNLHWFGGEPLFNCTVIGMITDVLRENNVPFRSSMTSNGYLFDEDTVHTAVERWNLKKVQITLDGTEEIYNRSKAYIYREGSPYRRVLRNIGLLLDAGVHVVIRLNIGRDNAGDLLALCDELNKSFPEKRNLRAYAALLKDFGNVKMSLGEEEQRLTAYTDLYRRLNVLGLYSARLTNQELKLNHCMADSDESIGILPDGRLTKCEHVTENDLVGTLSGPLPTAEACAPWRERVSVPECRACAHAPLCLDLKKCAGTEGTCTTLDRAVKDIHLLHSIRNTYEKEKNKAPITVSDNSEDDAELC